MYEIVYYSTRINICQQKINKRFELTMTTDQSRASIASISAQDSTPGHSLSTALLISSTTSNPLAELLLEMEIFSPSCASNSIDPSQP
jgi:hypothetical protein